MSIADNLREIKQNIEQALKKSPDPQAEVTLVAVTKQHNVEELHQLTQAGQLIFGENRVQEMLDKYEHLPQEINWHLIGHLQSNKVKYIADKVSLIHSLDSMSLADEISKIMRKYGRTMECLVQVNIANEEQKFGVAVQEAEKLIRYASSLPNIKIVGLMNIAPNYENKEDTRVHFRQMYELYEHIKKLQIDNVQMRYLSMGMSGDYTIAIEEGSNMVRIGSAVFKTEATV